MASISRGFGPRLLHVVIRHQAPCQCPATQARQLLRARFSTARCLQKAIHKLPQAVRTPPRPKPAATPSTPSPPATPSTPKLPATPKPAPPTATPTPTPTPTLARSTRPPMSYAEQLAAKGRTLLYEAPSHFWFRAGCFSSGVFCLTYMITQYSAVILHPPEGLSWWVPHAFTVILVAMGGMGGYFIMGAGRIISSIEAIPASQLAGRAVTSSAGVAAKAQQSTAAVSATAAAAATTAAAAATPLYVEVTTRRPFPFMPSKKHLLRPEEIELPFRMYSLFTMSKTLGTTTTTNTDPRQPPQSRLIGGGGRNETLAESVRRERAARDARAAERQYNLDHIMTSPFRDARKAFGGAWRGLRRSFNREGFIRVRLAGKQYKMDVTGGWTLDEGRALDRLLPVRQDTGRGVRR